MTKYFNISNIIGLIGFAILLRLLSPAFGWMGQNVVFLSQITLWKIAVWIIIASLLFAAGNARAERKYVPGNGLRAARVVIAIVSLLLATALVNAFSTNGLPAINLNGVVLPNSFPHTWEEVWPFVVMNWVELLLIFVIAMLLWKFFRIVLVICLLGAIVLLVGQHYLTAEQIAQLDNTTKNIVSTSVDHLNNKLATGNELSPAEQEAKHQAELLEAKRAADILAVQKKAEADAAIQEAAANAKAQEAARLAEEVSKNLPPSIKVPLCNMDSDGNPIINSMSAPVDIPPNWGFTAGWLVGTTPFAILKDGEWKIGDSFADLANNDTIRFCTTSKAHAERGDMSLSWYAK